MTDPSNWRKQLDEARALMDNLSSDPKLAAKEVRVAKAQLQAMKTGVNNHIKRARAHYQELAEKATYRPGMGGALLGASYRRAKLSAGAEEKARLQKQRNDALEPLVRLTGSIDEMQSRMDLVILELEKRANR